MLGRSVDPILALLAAGLERGDLRPVSADDPLETPEGYPGFDPIVRALLARRYRRAKQRVLWLAPAGPPAETDALVARMTYLVLAGAKLGSPEAVAGDYAAARAARPLEGAALARGLGRAPRLTLVVMALVLAVAGGASYAVWRVSQPRPRRPLSGVFERGGAPSGPSARYETLLGDTLPDWVIQVSHLFSVRSSAPSSTGAAERAVEEAQAKVLGAAAFDPGVRARLAELMKQAAALPASVKEVYSAADDLDEELEASGVPYYVNVDVALYAGGRAQLYLLAYAVNGVAIWDSGGRHYRALEVRRLDQLNLVEQNLGFVREGARHAIILSSKIEEELVQVVLPALAPDGEVELDVADSSPAAPLRTEAAAIMRAELTPLLRARVGDDGVLRVGRLGALLQKRLDLVRTWQARAAQGVHLSEPSRLIEGNRYDDVAARYGDPGAADAFAAIERQIDAEGRAGKAAYDAVLAIERGSVERHEVQHEIDADAPLAIPDALAVIAGDGADVSKAELSAYLAEIADGPAAPHMRLTGLLWLLVNPNMAGPHQNAAVVILEQLAGAGPDDGLVVDGEIAPGRVLALYRRTAALAPEALRARTREVYAQLFGKPLVAAVRAK